MSAPTPVSGDGSPSAGYYPDPSIPGYVRFWNGAAWVPGTSRPAPPAAAPPAQVEETGPVFLDEEPPSVSWGTPEPQDTPGPTLSDPRGTSPDTGPATATSGAGGSTSEDAPAGAGVTLDARLPADTGPGIDTRPAAPVWPEAPGSASAPGAPEAHGRLEGATRDTPAALASTQTGRPGTAGEGPDAGAATGVPGRRSAPQPQAAASTTWPEAPGSRREPAQPGGPAAEAAPSRPQTRPPASAHTAAPARTGWPEVPSSRPAPDRQPADRAQASWPQQVRQLAHPERQSQQSQQPVVPWKPPADDPFTRAARAQAATRPAGLGRRFAARIVDTLVTTTALGAVAMPLVSRTADHIHQKIEAARLSGRTVTVWLLDGTTGTYLGIVLGAFLLIGVLYEVLPTAKWGRTLGKKLCGVAVRGIESHEPPAFGAALGRWLVYGVLGLLAVGVVNVLWCVFDRPWRQCWHDKAARTFVAADR
ncbi:RDD family protein [Streptomyces sannanensis]|uniref:RDD family protein n=1 Tax=Streptomyces sannanensis TaxID=285536 RepID=A0ABP6SAG8_9ACTN